MKNTAGNATNAKRNPANNKGGIPSNPTFITTKLTPQAITIAKAKIRSFKIISTSLMIITYR
jgi:hypothetical protein